LLTFPGLASSISTNVILSRENGIAMEGGTVMTNINSIVGFFNIVLVVVVIISSGGSPEMAGA
jgi:hypothetical protein